MGTSITTDASNGCRIAELRYKAWGETRYTYGTTPTTYRFTGQKWEASLSLMFFNSRWYDSSLGRFIEPDTDVPESRESTSGFDRYAFVANNPIKYVDPGGHCWGIASSIRGLPGYAITCNNLDMALLIVQHPNASITQKAGAGAYIAAEGLAHGALALGVGALACSAVAPCETAIETALAVCRVRSFLTAPF